ncbi:Skb1 methyltransferase [Basidiobolus meristosporus CBS 931.73]|uniref:Protein arginine N-methyltransferase n=1 Tax=Basidiobolus meristosporus CBS 931.73 TaxID=1314790 RepID=A0A1Y1XN55_9FUNG|nr:Skb1 methyltransferase [Basidiobolus meristosporus CBS 931.73]|eukprot:ORX87190.1 Skb1 methyltransferase [Basidiobolus meristosporus CBS 931.73]
MSNQTLSIGCLPQQVRNLEEALEVAKQGGFHFIVTKIVHSDAKHSKPAFSEPKPFTEEDLIIKSSFSAENIVAQISDWIEFEQADFGSRISFEQAFKQQVEWASYNGVSAILFPSVANIDTIANFARCVNSTIDLLRFSGMWIRVPLLPLSEHDTWSKWNQLRTLCNHNSSLGITLELTEVLPEDEILQRWLSEPIRAVIVPTNIFTMNAKGYPVLSKKHQHFINQLFRFNPYFILAGEDDQLFDQDQESNYLQYLKYLNRTKPEPTLLEQHADGYEDCLQAPLQPLMDNLESSTYEVFEQCPMKYVQYEKAVYHALLDRVPPESDTTTVIMVVGAGPRGPLVQCCLRAAEKAQRKVKLYAVEKNRNAFVTLQATKEKIWGDQVQVVFEDMRKWKAPELADILVSELLGSFGDNELSPECLDGVQKFLKPDGISIPRSYSAYVSPLSSAKLHKEASNYKDRKNLETPYVVMFKAVQELAAPQKVWDFVHPNPHVHMDDEGHPTNNLHNVRYSHNTFTCTSGGLLHGLAGYFDSELYKSVDISIHPDTHTPTMFSWFPIYFPIEIPVQVPRGAKVETHIWRLTDQRKVWYEWAITVTMPSPDDQKDTIIHTTPIHNCDGRSSWIGL